MIEAMIEARGFWLDRGDPRGRSARAVRTNLIRLSPSVRRPTQRGTRLGWRCPAPRPTVALHEQAQLRNETMRSSPAQLGALTGRELRWRAPPGTSMARIALTGTPWPDLPSLSWTRRAASLALPKTSRARRTETRRRGVGRVGRAGDSPGGRVIRARRAQSPNAFAPANTSTSSTLPFGRMTPPVRTE